MIEVSERDMKTKIKKHLLSMRCSALCGREATGNLQVTNKTMLPMCEACRDLIDSDHHFPFIPFGGGGGGGELNNK